jgi:thioredoxin reductase (NADPH)
MGIHKIAIIGSGPAGLTAAIYTARANIDTTVFLGIQPGGQLTTTSEIENFPGFPDGIMGPDLMANMQKQAERFGAKTLYETVHKIEFDIDKREYTIHSDTGKNTYNGIIIASGAKARYLGIEGEEKYIGKGYHSCATCDGFFYRDKEIIVVGGGDSAMEEAIFLTKFANKVYLLNRTESFRASKIMLSRAKENPKIQFLTNQSITQFYSETDDKVNAVELINNLDQTSKKMPINGVFVAIGHIPNTDFVKGVLSMDETGYLQPIKRSMSEIEGIFIAGDVSDKQYRQAITAAGEGCRAAMDLEKWLESLK